MKIDWQLKSEQISRQRFLVPKEEFSDQINHGRDKAGLPYTSKQKIRIGFLKAPQSIETIEIGSPNPLEKSDGRSNLPGLIETSRFFPTFPAESHFKFWCPRPDLTFYYVHPELRISRWSRKKCVPILISTRPIPIFVVILILSPSRYLAHGWTRSIRWTLAH